MLVFILQMCDIQPRLLTFQLKTQVVNSPLKGNLMVLWQLLESGPSDNCSNYGRKYYCGHVT